MFSPEEYLNAWLIYLGGVVLMMACWWYLTHFLRWREFRQLSRIVVGTILLVPWYTDATGHYLAPAVIVAVVDALTLGVEAFWRAGTPLLIALIIGVVLSLAWSIWCWRQADKSGEFPLSE